jgi:hypothetical protein
MTFKSFFPVRWILQVDFQFYKDISRPRILKVYNGQVFVFHEGTMALAYAAGVCVEVGLCAENK